MPRTAPEPPPSPARGARDPVEAGAFLTPRGTPPLPFTLCVAASLVLHVGFFCVLPALRLRPRQPSIDTIVVELAREGEAPPSPAPRRPLGDQTAAPVPSPAPTSRPEQPGEEPQKVPPAAPQPPPVAPPPAPLPLATVRAVENVQPPKPERPAAAPKRPPKPLSDLLPSARDLAPFRTAKAPDPAGGGAREVSLNLGDTDPRYQGYLEQVHAGVFGSWHVGRGLLASRGPRRVVVRFTLTSLGLVETAEVVEGSGNPTLDAEALAALHRARLAPFPTHWTLERLSLVAQFDYDLR